MSLEDEAEDDDDEDAVREFVAAFVELLNRECESTGAAAEPSEVTAVPAEPAKVAEDPSGPSAPGARKPGLPGGAAPTSPPPDVELLTVQMQLLIEELSRCVAALAEHAKRD